MTIWCILHCKPPFRSCTIYVNEFCFPYRLQMSISANTSLPSSTPMNKPCPFSPSCQWAPQSFCSASPWRPLFSWHWFTSCPWLPCQPPARRRLQQACMTGTNRNKTVLTVTIVTKSFFYVFLFGFILIIWYRSAKGHVWAPPTSFCWHEIKRSSVRHESNVLFNIERHCA